jgi:hypothetical protein
MFALVTILQRCTDVIDLLASLQKSAQESATSGSKGKHKPPKKLPTNNADSLKECFKKLDSNVAALWYCAREPQQAQHPGIYYQVEGFEELACVYSDDEFYRNKPVGSLRQYRFV